MSVVDNDGEALVVRGEARSAGQASLSTAGLGTGTFGVTVRGFILCQELVHGLNERFVPKGFCNHACSHQAPVDVVLGSRSKVAIRGVPRIPSTWKCGGLPPYISMMFSDAA